MSTSVKQLCETFESLWPISGAEEWDRPGLTCGSLESEVSKVLLVLDVTTETIQEAIDLDCQLILSHHPVLLKPVNFLPDQSLKGSILSLAMRNSISLYSAHTNADIVHNGVSDVFAKSLGLVGTRPLVPMEFSDDVGHGRVGELGDAVSLSVLASKVSDILTASNAPVRVSGSRDQVIKKVAVVGGAGDSFLEEALKQEVDCFITSDLRHHVLLDALGSIREKPFSVIDVSHFGAESLWLSKASSELSVVESDVEFKVSKINTDPWSFSLQGKAKG